MNWSDKSIEIAKTVASKYKGKVTLSIRQDELIALLSRAAYAGMEYELQAWLNRPRKNVQTTETT